jgi:hypothetical protein
MESSNSIYTSNGTYIIKDKIGEGRYAKYSFIKNLISFISVKSCEDENTGLKYAAKIFKEREGSLSSSSEVTTLFIQEI